MLQVHNKYENLISETFKNDPLFLSALDKACASVINSKLYDGKTTCRSAELVSFNNRLHFKHNTFYLTLACMSQII